MAVKKKKIEEPIPHYETSTQGPFTGVPGWAKQQAGIKLDGEHAKPGSWVPGYVPNQQPIEGSKLPPAKTLKKTR